MDPSLLKYTTTQDICLFESTRREMHDVVRSVAVHPERIRVCSCVADHWIRSALSFLHAVWIPSFEQCKQLKTPSLPAVPRLFSQPPSSSAQ